MVSTQQNKRRETMLFKAILIKALLHSLKIEIQCSIGHQQQRCMKGTKTRIVIKRTPMAHLHILLSKLSGLWRAFRASSMAEGANKTRLCIHLPMSLLPPHHSVLEASTNQSFGWGVNLEKERCGRRALSTLLHLKALDCARLLKTLCSFSQMAKILKLIDWISINLNLIKLEIMIYSAEKLGK